ncbi:hypothetical protein [Phenylobacterium sp.]|uniref:hypothetical protein n=1 Tax=Phenylobacterium sp. TaxID=1871053 RepID=UPI001215D970|nr:hypothetical protein [Phenylobacterium sp.]THD58362.1 MAG: hypothetical protein E8A49_19740 [Phenylobacterium sp.]
MQNRPTPRAGDAKVVHFDEALLSACGSDLKAELITEAAMLAEAFAPEGGAGELEAMADALARGTRDATMDRARALKLACALRCLARAQSG